MWHETARRAQAPEAALGFAACARRIAFPSEFLIPPVRINSDHVAMPCSPESAVQTDAASDDAQSLQTTYQR